MDCVEKKKIVHGNYLDFACFGPRDGKSESHLQLLISKSTIYRFSKQNKSAYKKPIQAVFLNKRRFPGGSPRYETPLPSISLSDIAVWVTFVKSS